VAAVIERAGPPLDVAELDALCRRDLAGYKVPEIWSVGHALPVNAMGKVSRTGLPELIERHRLSRP
jgi:acyl-CoA synthetase (AMP-forming)/AMP-acid ligase II